MPEQLIIADGFDTYSTAAHILRRWPSAYNYDFGTLSTGRFGQGKAFRVYSNGGATVPMNNTSYQAFRMSCAIYWINGGGPGAMFRITDGATVQLSLGVTADQRLASYLGSSTVTGTSSQFFRIGVWYHIEWYAVVSATLGTNHFVARVNNEEWLNISGSAGRSTANNIGDGFLISIPNGNFGIDDFILWGEDVTNSPTFFGDTRVQTLYPAGNGASSQFVGSDGNSTDNYLLVDDPQINDADFVGSSVVGNKDLYTLQDLPSTTVTVRNVAVVGQCYRSDAGPRTGKHLVRIGGTDYEGSEYSPPSSPMSIVHNYIVNPATGTAWTPANVNSIEIGVKVQS